VSDPQRPVDRKRFDSVLGWLATLRLKLAFWAAVAAPLLGGLVGIFTNKTQKILLILGAAAAAGLAFGVTYARVRAAEEARDRTRAQMLTTINAGLTPLASALNRTIGAENSVVRRAQASKGLTVALNVAKDVIGPQEVRACWYELTEPSTLLPRESVGRTQQPRTTFRAGTPSGDAALKMVFNDDVLLVNDIREDPSFADRETKPTYESYIAASVSSGETPYGMLTLDAPHAGDLIENDAHTLHLIASQLAAMMHAARDTRKRPKHSAEPDDGNEDGKP